MKKTISFLVLLVLLCCTLTTSFAAQAGFHASEFDRAYSSGKLALEEVWIPGSESVRWLSISPSGRWLLGLHSDGYLTLYNLPENKWSQMTIDDSNDTYGNLSYLTSRYNSFKNAQIIWSRYETRFAWINYNDVMLKLNLSWDLFVGNTKTNTIGVYQTWERSFRATNGGAVYQVCFSGEDKLYYSFYGNEQVFDTRSATVLHDLTTGQNTVVSSNTAEDADGSTYQFIYSGLYQMDDGSLLQFGMTNSQESAVRLLERTGDGWNATIYPLEAMEQPSNIVLSASGKRALIRYNTVDSSTRQNVNRTLLLYVNAGGVGSRALDDMYNAQFAPNGKYLVTLNRVNGACCLQAFDLVAFDLGVSRSRVITVPKSVSASGNLGYLAGRNALSAAFDEGFLWGGDYLLLGLKEGPKLFRFTYAAK